MPDLSGAALLLPGWLARFVLPLDLRNRIPTGCHLDAGARGYARASVFFHLFDGDVLSVCLILYRTFSEMSAFQSRQRQVSAPETSKIHPEPVEG